MAPHTKQGKIVDKSRKKKKNFEKLSGLYFFQSKRNLICAEI
jgi:hypothetical protein